MPLPSAVEQCLRRPLFKPATVEEDEGTAVMRGMHANGAFIRIRFRGGLPALPDPIPDVLKPQPPRQLRPAQRPVCDPRAFYTDDDGPEFGA